ncbi:hypothetical protein XELAEV_18028971mg [Xenopus laevis]|uniref:Uncharacterized protein n=1 Tax=Xenopus laevis TaxID=8355 RepID=A0A974CQS1_XENLA|nr:hypothetical protein XELAEV_18032857mg [Xenopus laevis]OCT77873.1 hypothetical protein XELAEV_18028971mg [Xenopus laevis]
MNRDCLTGHVTEYMDRIISYNDQLFKYCRIKVNLTSERSKIQIIWMQDTLTTKDSPCRERFVDFHI